MPTRRRCGRPRAAEGQGDRCPDHVPGQAQQAAEALVWFNKAVAPIRAGVERLLGTMKRASGYRRVRYHGLARNNVQLQFLGTAINLRRGLKLGLA